MLAGPSGDHAGSPAPTALPATRRRSPEVSPPHSPTVNRRRSRCCLAFEVRQRRIGKWIVGVLQASQFRFILRRISVARQHGGSVEAMDM